VDEPDGIVAVWNMNLKENPEFVFHAQVSLPKISTQPASS